MIFTFYSFKGGVGRSMALANAAEVLYQRGLKVLLVDFDLEAPGLERFFEVPDAATTHAEVLAARGLIDMLLSYKELRGLVSSSTHLEDVETGPDSGSTAFAYPVEPMDNFIVDLYGPNATGGQLRLIPAGRRAGDEYTRYAEKVRSFDWDDFYLNWEGEQFFEWFRAETTKYDVVLIDSRTGIAEMTGVCTHHLADVVLMFAATSRQNVDGCVRVAQSLSKKELVERGRRGRPMSLIMIPSRVEPGEGDKLDEFAALFEHELAPFNSEALQFENGPFISLRIPYVPFFAYSEDVACRPPEKPKAAELVAAYHRITTAMVQLAPSDSTLCRKYYASQSRGHVVRPDAPPLPVAPHFVGREWLFDTVEEWLADDTDRTLLILGGPGSGKTAVAARLVQMSNGDVPVDKKYRFLRPGWLAYAHFCSASDLTSLDTRRFVAELSKALAERDQSFSAALFDTLADGHSTVRVDFREPIGIRRGSMQVRDIDIGAESARAAFHALVVKPLRTLRSDSIDPVVILVDGLDQTRPDDGRDSIAMLLTDVTRNERELLHNLRFLFTSRPQVELATLTATRIDLGADKPFVSFDVQRMVQAHLATMPLHLRDPATHAITVAAQGNMFFAEAAAVALLADPTRWEDPIKDVPVPHAIAEVYRQAIQRVLQGDARAWGDRHRDFLGFAVAHAPLYVEQVAGILRLRPSEAGDLARTWAAYLRSATSALSLFHASFRDFLLSDVSFRVYEAEMHGLVGTYFCGEYAGDWRTCDDDYAIRYTPIHLC
ncbi:MAG: hypothetical protein IPG72_06330 [Ardenticatenales bacterium]|nr:hypothetical protein [Ardenticatenales bacterium]